MENKFQGAVQLNLTDKEDSMLTVLNWLENLFGGKAIILDIDFDTGSLSLYGEPTYTSAFRKQFEIMMMQVYNYVPFWKTM